MVANIDQEMMRIAGEGQDCLARLAAEITDVPVERVVRFGRLTEEVRIEAEAFAADLVALAAPLSPGLWHRALAWYLGRVGARLEDACRCCPRFPPTGRSAARATRWPCPPTRAMIRAHLLRWRPRQPAQRTRKYASPAAFGRRLAAGPFSSL